MQLYQTNSHSQGAWQKCVKHRATWSVLVLLLILDAISSLLLCVWGWPVYIVLGVSRLLALLVGFLCAIQFGTGAWTCSGSCRRSERGSGHELSHAEEGGARPCRQNASQDRIDVPLCTYSSQRTLSSTSFLSQPLADIRESQDCKEASLAPR
jgi:hypothetical protein